MIAGAVLKLSIQPASLVASVLGFVLAGGFLLVVGLLRKDAMGGGDVKLAALMGLILDSKVIIALFLAFIVGAAAGILLILLKIRGRKELIPFGPFLALGGLITLFWSQELLNVYLGRFQ
jgi:leader peptidase (prepilin peptidase)/N-methyltransferase